VLINLKEISDGSKLYLRPVGRISAGYLDVGRSFDFAGTGIRFGGAVVYARTPANGICSGYFSVDTLRTQMADCSANIATALRSQIKNLSAPRAPLKLSSGKTLALARPLVMGVLNVTPDSFSDGGKFLDSANAVRRARAMAAAGADIIDIGGESTRPGATPVWEGEEAERVIPVIEAMAAEPVTLSVDTRNSFVMERALNAGADIINDVSALLHDPDSMAVAVKSGAPVVLMHAQGAPETMQDNPDYEHVLLDVYDYLSARVDACVAAGIARERIILDPGIGFGKRVVQDNIALINGLMLFQTLGCPILLGASRKRFIGAITGVDNASERTIGSVIAAAKGVEQGANILRVHDVAQTVEAVKMIQGFSDASVMDGVV